VNEICTVHELFPSTGHERDERDEWDRTSASTRTSEVRQLCTHTESPASPTPAAPSPSNSHPLLCPASAARPSAAAMAAATTPGAAREAARAPAGERARGGGPSANDGPCTVERMISDVHGLCLSTDDYKKVVLKFLRVDSTQNAALEMKHEVAAVRLLQFGLTAANLGYAVMSAVELAELAELKTGAEPNEDDEGVGTGGSVEMRELSLEFREACALVLTRFVLEARCKIKITHAGGVKVFTWSADGATSSGA
jgi:hypothetical protein